MKKGRRVIIYEWDSVKNGKIFAGEGRFLRFMPHDEGIVALVEKPDGTIIMVAFDFIAFCNDEKANGVDNVLDKAAGLEWIVKYIKDEDFPPEHIRALQRIIMMFNQCLESEKKVFAFSRELYEKYNKI